MEGVVTIMEVLFKRMTKVMSHMTYIGEMVVECECTRIEWCREWHDLPRRSRSCSDHCGSILRGTEWCRDYTPRDTSPPPESVTLCILKYSPTQLFYFQRTWKALCDLYQMCYIIHNLYIFISYNFTYSGCIFHLHFDLSTLQNVKKI